MRVVSTSPLMVVVTGPARTAIFVPRLAASVAICCAERATVPCRSMSAVSDASPGPNAGSSISPVSSTSETTALRAVPVWMSVTRRPFFSVNVRCAGTGA